MAKKKATKTVATAKRTPKIRPLGDRVLIKPLSAAKDATPSGIILPDSAKDEKTDRGKVIAVGEGKRTDDGSLVPLSVREGDTVLFQWGEKAEIGDEEYYIVGENNILGILG